MGEQATITLVGCGKMGSALLEGWLNAFPDYDFGVIEPNTVPENIATNITHAASASELADFIRRSDIIILAVKPQIMQDVCKDLEPFTGSNTLILSIAAGQSLGNFATYFGEDQPAIRAMPNTPAIIGKGISVAVGNTKVSDNQKSLADSLLHKTGFVEWIEDESLLDAVTAVSGSGPAYVFYLIEVLSEAAIKAGLEPDLAKTLARQTVTGSAALAEHEPDTRASTLRENVTSPGGTTEAALGVLMDGQMQEIFIKAIAAAKKRSQELG